MKRISLRLVILILTFLLGVAVAGLSSFTRVIVMNRVQHETYTLIPDTTNEEGWNAVLARFQEMPLKSLPAGDESYRLIWIPSFHPPVSVRIWSSQGKRFLVANQLSGKGGYGMGKLVLQKGRQLNEEEWFGFTRRLSHAGYWDMPAADEALPPNDGALWVIEGVANGKLHDVHRRSPRSEFRDACIYLVKLSGLQTEIERY